MERIRFQRQVLRNHMEVWSVSPERITLVVEERGFPATWISSKDEMLLIIHLARRMDQAMADVSNSPPEPLFFR
jgi:hypothetical protein